MVFVCAWLSMDTHNLCRLGQFKKEIGVINSVWTVNPAYTAIWSIMILQISYCHDVSDEENHLPSVSALLFHVGHFHPQLLSFRDQL